MKKSATTATTPATTVSKREFAVLQHVSAPAVSKWIALGLPVGPDGRIDTKDGLAWLAANVQGRGRGAAKRRRQSEDLMAARTRKESALADLRTLEVRERQRGNPTDADITREATRALSRMIDYLIRILPFEVLEIVTLRCPLNDADGRDLAATLSQRITVALQNFTTVDLRSPMLFTPASDSNAGQLARRWLDLSKEPEKEPGAGGVQ